jgi:hypothetical protein
MSRTWEELQIRKEEALLNDDFRHAAFWQNEQLILKLNAVTWHLKLMADKEQNV